MIIGAATEINKSAHRVSIALHGIDSKEYTSEELIHLIKVEDARLSKVDDGEILNNVLKEVSFLKGKTIIQKDTNRDKFIVFSNNIPLKTEIRVKCTCSDFFYTFAWYNADHKVLIGRRPPKYKRYLGLTSKEKEDIVPVRNPRRLPGVCKHILLFLALLMDGKILDESQPIMTSFKKSSSRLEIIPRSEISSLLKKLKTELNKEKITQRQQRIEAKEQEKKAVIKRTRTRRKGK
jgi:hypothetical protein